MCHCGNKGFETGAAWITTPVPLLTRSTCRPLRLSSSPDNFSLSALSECGGEQGQRPKCGSYRTVRSQVRVVVRKPGQQCGQGRMPPGLPAEPVTSTVRSL